MSANITATNSNGTYFRMGVNIKIIIIIVIIIIITILSGVRYMVGLLGHHLENINSPQGNNKIYVHICGIKN